MSTDDEFARHLRSRVEAAAPTIDVDTVRVVPRARRRRAWTRAAGAGAAGGLVLAGVLVGQAWAGAPWSTHTLAGPAGTGEPVATEEPSPDPSPDPSADPSADATAAEEALAAAEAAADAALRADTAQGAAPYWYTRYTSSSGFHESWTSRDRPGLLVSNGDLAGAEVIEPSDVVGRFRIDGVWHEELRDPGLLPTDPAELEAVFRASIEPDRRSGSDDDKVFGMAYDLVNDGSWLPSSLLQAAWQVAGSLPGSQVTPGTDGAGRAGEVLVYTPSGGDGPIQLVADPRTGELMQIDSLAGTGPVVIEHARADAVPVQPSLEGTGCRSWETC